MTGAGSNRTPVGAWIHDAGALPTEAGTRRELGMRIHFDSQEDFKAALNGAPVVLSWIFDSNGRE